MSKPRLRVKIRCRICGESYSLRGKREKGKMQTGFKQCLCGNDAIFDVKVDD